MQQVRPSIFLSFLIITHLLPQEDTVQKIIPHKGITIKQLEDEQTITPHKSTDNQDKSTIQQVSNG